MDDLLPTTGETTQHGPLLVIPLPADARLVADLGLAASRWWEATYGRPMRIGPDLDEQDTPYGRALVLSAPEEEEAHD